MIEQDFLTVIRETEERAEALIASAHADARQRVDDARAEAERRIVAAREEAENNNRQILEAARGIAGSKDQEGIAATAGHAGEIREAAAPSIENAVRIVAERIVK